MVVYHELYTMKVMKGPCFKFYFVTRLSYLAAWPFLEARTLQVFIPFFVARLTHPPTQETGRW